MSILDQLKKYQAEHPPAKIVEVPDSPSGPYVDYEALARGFGCPPSLLHDMPWFTWTNVLYPAELVAAYHLYSKQRYVSEDVCNHLTIQFMHRVHPVEYTASFSKAMDGTVARLIQARALVATFYTQPVVNAWNNNTTSTGSYEPVKYDKLGSSFRPEIAAALGVPVTISLREASNLMVDGNKAATYEQQILGRIGYLILWSKLTKSKLVHEGLMIDHKHS